MERSSVLFVGLALISVAVNCSFADTKVDVEANVVSDSNSTDPTRLGGSELVSNNDTNAMKMDNKQLVSVANEGESGKASKSRGSYGESKKKGSDETGKEDLSTLSRKKEGFHGEECDPSNMCVDQEDQFVACLRVPGNDSPHLSLLIQNKGKSPLLVTISAPAFVRLENNKVQLLKNGDKKVKVSITDRGSDDNAIILTAGRGRCTLELKESAAHEAGDDDSADVSRASIMNFRSQTLIIIIIFFIVCALILVPAFIHLYRNKSLGNKYQRLDAEQLPVTGSGSKADDGGWDNDWGDDWDGEEDEEAPKTPMLPVTPRVSSGGLASRRLSKEGWKD